MKLTLVIILMFSMTSIFGQNIDSLGLGSNYYLNKQEINYFDSIFKDVQVINPSGKFAFLAGQTTIIISKKDFFDQYIIPAIINNSLPKLSTKELNENEKAKSGGFDYLIMTHSAAPNKKIYKELYNLQPNK